MKDIRNTIVHEYIEDDLVDVFDEVLEYTEKLIDIMNYTIKYIDDKNMLKGTSKNLYSS